MNAPETFGERIARLRRRGGMTQADLGVRLGASNVTVSRWEQQWMTPKPPAMQRLARVLGVTVHYLHHGHEAPFRRAA
jgi:transcriptional regulator with XRE-family HTH domain